jgi:hypothetical protein
LTDSFVTQITLVSLLIDLALLAVIHTRMSGSNLKLVLGITILVFAFGAFAGYMFFTFGGIAWELLLGFYIILWPPVVLGMVMVSMGLKGRWIPMIILVVGVGTWLAMSWEFQSAPMKVYELALGLLILVILCYRYLTRSVLGGEYIYMISAVALIIVMGPVYHTMSGSLEVELNLFTLGASVAGILMCFGFLHFKPLLVEPVHEVLVGKRIGKATHLEPGIHMYARDQSGEIERLFNAELAKGRYGLWVSMDHPSVIRSRLGVESTPVVHLTHSTYGDLYVNPSDTALIARTLEEFARRGEGCVMVIEHPHYMVSNSRIWPVLEGLEHLFDVIQKTGGLLILGNDLLTKKEIGYLTEIGVKKFGS